MSRMRRAEPSTASRAVTALLAAVALTSCDASMSVFSPASGEGSRLTSLTWFLVVSAAVIYAIVMAFMIAAIVRRRRDDTAGYDLTSKSTMPVVIGGAVLPGIILATLFIVALGAMRSYPTPVGARVLTYRVTAHQWWWQVQYEDAASRANFQTANEIHVPVGQPVQILLTSADVIHSFWVPRLQGKIDVIPGDTNAIRFVATEPGTYRGQCAEYCGMQHAHMAFTVVAEDSGAFSRWLAAERMPAVPPADSEALLGQRMVVGGPCALCHAIAGTPAGGLVGPDLTHVGSRLTLAAGTLPNSMGNMEAWITNAQSLKPGARMPTITQFTGRELRAMAAYLESLK